jgi:hypothetical protein
MLFRSKDHTKYIESGQQLSKEMFESVAEYFENIYNLQMVNGSLAKKRKANTHKFLCGLPKTKKPSESGKDTKNYL